MKTIRSILIWSFCILDTLLVTIPVLLCSTILLPFNPQRTWAHAIGIFWARLVFWINPGWRVTITGKHHIPKGASVLIANHESMADIIAVYLLGCNFKWLAKKSLFKIPFFGWSMSLCGYIPLERGSVKSTVSSMDEARAYLRKGIPILIFPEGTRSRDGHLGKFKGGAFRLALDEKVPIIPVVMKGTRDVLEKGSWRLASKIHCMIKVLPGIDPAKERNLSEDELSTKAKHEIETALRDLA